ncbi:MAG TPA: 3-phosphoshikimate 1-carboxyvinyltransferase [Acidimicrobiales bacterium]|nr:3-phosphoshikimate 1-carboxyvinyltransferase [Acidimicrobiales bacterium]
MSRVNALEVRGGFPLKGTIQVPGDKSISHRALILAAMGGGTSELAGISDGDDVARTAAAISHLGAGVSVTGRDNGRISLTVAGGPRRLHEPAQVLDLGNSGTGIRLLAGMAAGFSWTTILTGDVSLSSRPMDRISGPLRRMGAKVDGRQDAMFSPLVVRGGDLQGIDYSPPMPSAQVKSAILLAGLRADGETIVREAVATRSHTEELISYCGGNITATQDGRGRVVKLVPGPLDPFKLNIPGDPSQAAFWVVAALCVEGSEIVLPDVYSGPERIGYIEVLRRMGADIDVKPEAGQGSTTATITARYSGKLRATQISGDEISGLDEVPILAVAAATAQGRTTFSKVAELRGKETDRLATISSELGALGALISVEEGPVIAIEGGGFKGGIATSHGDHRIAMACAIAGCAGSNAVRVEGWDAVATSYPMFAEHLRRLSRWK